jgi:GNAT superfamily N-acetyltransferase
MQSETVSLSISLEPSPSPQDVSIVEAGLRAYNLLHAPDDDHQLLHIFLRAPDGSIRGGLLGDTYWGWLYIRILWLHESVRQQGYGGRMLALAEAEAVRRGCHAAHLDTMSFQAQPFYERHGYTVFGVLDDLPVGHRRIFLQKTL